MKSFYLLLFYPFLLFNSYSDTIYVPLDYSNIQAAIDSSLNGDVIIVLPGTYLENIDFKGKSITVTSEQDPNVTVIDGGAPYNPDYSSVVIFHNNEGSDSVLKGFTLTNGLGTYDPVWTTLGGGIYCNMSSPTLCNNIIENNNAFAGGGIACYGNKANPFINKCVIKNNTAGSGGGGGIFCNESNAVITKCTIEENNSGGYGGGIRIFMYSTPNVIENTIENNVAEVFGGGIYASASAKPHIMQNSINSNLARNGGGIYFNSGKISYNLISFNVAKDEQTSYIGGDGGGISCGGSSDQIISYNIITNNSAKVWGGGIFYGGNKGIIKNNVISNNKSSGGTCYPRLNCGGGIFIYNPKYRNIMTNCLLYNNYADDFGGGSYFSFNTKLEMINCSISKNTAKKGSGIYCDNNSILDISNSIIWGNSGDEVYYRLSMPTITYSNVRNGFPGVGNITEDPLFVNSYKNDYHITYFSPCKNTGNNSLIFDNNDIENDPRIADGTVDMGADEFYTHIYYMGDTTPGGHIDMKLIDVPKTSPVYLWIGSDILDPPLHLKNYGDWYLTFPLIYEIHLGSIPSSNGVLNIEYRLPVSTPVPIVLPLQALIGSQLTNLCNLEIR